MEAQTFLHGSSTAEMDDLSVIFVQCMEVWRYQTDDVFLVTVQLLSYRRMHCIKDIVAKTCQEETAFVWYWKSSIPHPIDYSNLLSL